MLPEDRDENENGQLQAIERLPLSPCVLGRAVASDGSCFLEVDMPLILLASIATDGHA
jgi:hypothetical protein